MSMSHTIQGGYEPMRRADVTAVDVSLDPTGDVKTVWLTDLTVKDVFELGPEYNACEIISWGEGDDSDSMAFRLWGGAGGAGGGNVVGERLCEISACLGAARADVTNPDATTRLFVDTMTIDSQSHIKTISVVDSGNNRVAKLAFDLVGFRYLYPEVYKIGTDATNISRVNFFIRPI